MEQATLTPRDYVTIARRKKWHFVLPTVLVLALAVLAALMWPPTYRSEATVLIEQPEVPQDLVSTLITDYVERRLEAITRKVMVTDNLIRIIERYDLYTDKRADQPITEVVDAMRDDIRMEVLSTEVIDPSSGRSSSSAVAFTVAFDHRDPETAQRVANELVSLYLNENLRQRRERASQTANFLRAERQRVEQQIAKLGDEFTAYKAAHNGSLPDQLLFNQQQLARAEQELRDVDRQIQSLREREAYLSAQLTLTEPYQLYASTSQAVLSPPAQLETMRMELSALRARYGSQHPDVIRVSRQVRSLEESLGVAPEAGRFERERELIEARLSELRQRYTADHPDVQRAQRELAAVDRSLASVRRSSQGSGEARPDNPAYIQLQSDLSAVRAELPSLAEQRAKVSVEIDRLEGLLIQTPIVEREYSRLDLALQEAITAREDLAQREMTAQLGQNLEAEAKGERFALIEPPLLPTDPVKPSKLLIAALGMVLAVGSGVGMVTMSHLLDDNVYSTRDVAQVIGEAPLSVVPRVVTFRDRLRSGGVLALVLLAFCAAIGGVLWYVHTYLVPIDVLAYGLERRAGGLFSPFLSSGSDPLTSGTGQ